MGENRKPKVGERVSGRYENKFYTGVVSEVHEDYFKVDKEDYNKGWRCRKRENGSWACADGCDDGKHDIEFLDKPTLEREYQEKIPVSDMYRAHPYYIQNFPSFNYGMDFGYEEYKPSSIKNKINKTMKCAADVIKKITRTDEEKLLIEFSATDEDGKWIDQGKQAILDLEAKERGYKSYANLCSVVNDEYDGDPDCELDPLALDELITKHKPALLEALKAEKAEEKKNK